MSDRPASRSIAQALRRLSLLTAVPFFALIALLAWVGYQHARGNAEAFVQRQAARVSADVTTLLAETERGLHLVAARPAVRRLDAAHCDPGLGDLIAINPEYANVNVIDRDGWVICGAVAPRGGARSINVSDREWFRAVMAGRTSAIGVPRKGPILGRWVASVAAPIKDAGGEVGGVIVTAIDLVKWEPPGVRGILPRDAVLGVLDTAGTMVLRFPDAENWVGRENANAPIAQTMLRLREGVFQAAGLSGLERIWAVTPVPGTDWLAFAGIGTHAVLGPPLREAGVAVILSVLALVVALSLAFKASQGIVRPIAAIAQAVRARIAGGDDPVPVAGPGEVAEVAEELNRLIQMRREAAAQVRKLSRAVEQGPATIVITDRAGSIEYVNPRFEETTGYTRAEAIGKNPRLLKSGVTLPDTYTELWKTISAGREWRGELCNRRKDGSLYWEFAAISGLKDEDGAISNYVAVKEDITERKRAEEEARQAHEQLRQVTAELNSLREAESRTLSRELHDEFGQMLTSLKMNISWIESRLEKEQTELKEKVAASLALVDASVQSVRNIAARLRPRILDDLGLLSAIDWLVQDFRERSGLDAALVSNTQANALGSDRATAVFRIAQEALTNIARHADAKRVDVSLYAQDGWLTLEVRDDGKGARMDAKAGRESIGLLGMRERAIAAGGELTLRSVPGRGTVVALRLPLVPDADKAKEGERA